MTPDLEPVERTWSWNWGRMWPSMLALALLGSVLLAAAWYSRLNWQQQNYVGERLIRTFAPGLIARAEREAQQGHQSYLQKIAERKQHRYDTFAKDPDFLPRSLGAAALLTSQRILALDTYDDLNDPHLYYWPVDALGAARPVETAMDQPDDLDTFRGLEVLGLPFGIAATPSNLRWYGVTRPLLSASATADRWRVTQPVDVDYFTFCGLALIRESWEPFLPSHPILTGYGQSLGGNGLPTAITITWDSIEYEAPGRVHDPATTTIGKPLWRIDVNDPAIRWISRSEIPTSLAEPFANE